MHDNSLHLFNKHAAGYFKPGMRVLEIGATTTDSAYKQALASKDFRWDTLDLQGFPGVTYVATSDYAYPIAENSYDIVLAGQVIEHVKMTWLWMKELKRILVPGGRLITIGPNSWPYHEAPVDCWRIFPEGMQALCDFAGLAVDFCATESLEKDRYGRTRPGKGRVSTSIKSKVKYALLGPLSYLGFPISVSYDTITIARKPAAKEA